MVIYLPRSEILRQVRALLGMATSDVIASQVGDQHLAYVQSAAREVAASCRWVDLRAEVALDIGEEQELLDYPENAGPGSVMGASCWDIQEEAYSPLIERTMPVVASLDQLAVIGGATFEQGQGRPRSFEQLSQIKIFPATDKPYRILVRYQRPVEMPTAASMSLVDAQLIIWRAASMALEALGDMQLADRYMQRSTKRLGDLRAWAQGSQTLQLNHDADMGENEHLTITKPRWDTNPTVRPGMFVP